LLTFFIFVAFHFFSYNEGNDLGHFLSAWRIPFTIFFINTSDKYSSLFLSQKWSSCLKEIFLMFDRIPDSQSFSFSTLRAFVSAVMLGCLYLCWEIRSSSHCCSFQ
jgi:hypothetical protein